MGEQVWIGPGATLIQRLTIGDRARISAGSCVIQNVPADQQVTGNIAVDHQRFLRHIASIG
jgi:UDP-3-O-[3-hydroxymyristoyl] glucosamine N-acyltransferase